MPKSSGLRTKRLRPELQRVLPEMQATPEIDRYSTVALSGTSLGTVVSRICPGDRILDCLEGEMTGPVVYAYSWTVAKGVARNMERT